MSPGPSKTLLISEVEKWKPERLGSDATNFGTIVTQGDELLKGMLTKQHEIADSWKGAGADSATARVTHEQTAGSHIMGKVEAIKGIYTTHQTQLADAKNFVIQKRNLIQGMGFEVADDGTVTANAKIAAALAASGDSKTEPGSVSNAILQIKRDAAEQHVAMVSALQNADNTATSAKAALDLAAGELGQLSLHEVPPKQLRTLFPGLSHPGTAKPGELPPNWQLVGDTMKLEQGIPLTVTNPDGSTTTLAPNGDGTLTTTTSVHQPDGSTITTTSTDGKAPTTTVTTPRNDGSGILDLKVTGPDGKQQRLQTVPQGTDRSATFAVNPDGSQGAKLSETYKKDGGLVTDVYGKDGLDREWKRPDGFRTFEHYADLPGGHQALLSTSNSAGVHSELQLPDNTIKTTFPNGQTAQTAQFPDGQVVTKFSDGSVLGYDPSKAAPGSPKHDMWDSIGSWTGGHVNGVASSMAGAFPSHPYMTGLGLASDASSEVIAHGGETMAQRAAVATGQSMDASARALSSLDTGTPGAGRAMVDSMDAAADASSAASKADALKFTSKWGGMAASAGINAYTNYEDWQSHSKTGWQAVGNAVGGTAGGIVGAMGGAKLGAMACAPFVEVPIVPVLCTAGGAAIGGFLGGQAGGYVAEQPFH